MGFIKESAFYNKFIPEYNRMQREHNLVTNNIFPKCYFTSESEIILEDLRKFNFIASKESLNKKQTVLVLQEIAKFHATGVALKIFNPDLFHKKLVVIATPALQNEYNPEKENIDKEFRSEIRKLLKSMKGFAKYADSVDLILSKIDQTKLPVPNEPYATILHNDLWIGNILFKYANNNNEPIEVKLVDFQTTIYNSPARDLVYFLFTSVNTETLTQFTDLIIIYHNSLVHNLTKLGVDVLQFTFEKLMIEINVYGPSKLKHMLKLFKTRSSNGVLGINFELQLQRIISLFNERKWI